MADPLLWIGRKLGLVHPPAKNPETELRAKRIEQATAESRERLDAIQQRYEARAENARLYRRRTNDAQ